MIVKSIRNNIPNGITMLNLLSGAVSVILALSGDLYLASWFILLAAVFDFFDGFLARLMNVKSDIGAQLDSLADVISFGLAPAAILYILFKQSPDLLNLYIGETAVLPFVSLLIAMASAFRLARFNNEPSQEVNFSGLPTPATGLFMAALPLMLAQSDRNLLLAEIMKDQYTLLAVTVFFSYLMVSRIPMISMKFANFTWRENKYRFILIFSSVILVALFKFSGLAMSILLYIVISLIDRGHRSAKSPA